MHRANTTLGNEVMATRQTTTTMITLTSFNKSVPKGIMTVDQRIAPAHMVRGGQGLYLDDVHSLVSCNALSLVCLPTALGGGIVLRNVNHNSSSIALLHGSTAVLLLVQIQ